MTEAGEKWVEEHSYDNVYSTDEAEHYIRAFCDEVEKRAKELNSDPIDKFHILGWTLAELKHELLGGNNAATTQ